MIRMPSGWLALAGHTLHPRRTWAHESWMPWAQGDARSTRIGECPEAGAELSHSGPTYCHWRRSVVSCRRILWQAASLDDQALRGLRMA